MRRTLTLVAVTAALLVPASAASAAPAAKDGERTNASCNSKHGQITGTWNEKGEGGNLDGNSPCGEGTKGPKTKPAKDAKSTTDPAPTCTDPNGCEV